jgi:hypothetical protein
VAKRDPSTRAAPAPSQPRRAEARRATLQPDNPERPSVDPSSSDIEIHKCASEHDDLIERWVRATDDEPVFGVAATRLLGDHATWEVIVSAARHVRGEPLRSTLEQAILDHLTALPEVFDAFQEDREIWMVHGEVGADALIRACSAALDGLADALRESHAHAD